MLNWKTLTVELEVPSQLPPVRSKTFLNFRERWINIGNIPYLLEVTSLLDSIFACKKIHLWHISQSHRPATKLLFSFSDPRDHGAWVRSERVLTAANSIPDVPWGAHATDIEAILQVDLHGQLLCLQGWPCCSVSADIRTTGSLSQTEAWWTKANRKAGELLIPN